MLNDELIRELQTVPEIAQALEIAKESGYTKEELLAYDKFWDAIRTEKTLINDAEERGIQIGEERGITSVILNGIDKGLSIEMLSSLTNLSKEKIASILEDHKDK